MKSEKENKTKNLPVPAPASIFFDIARFEFAQRVAKVFAESTMVPGHFHGNVGNCVIALNLAERMKLDPFMLMQNMYIVYGTPGIEAKLAIALVNASGRFEPLRYECENKGTDKEAWRAYAISKKDGKTIYGPWISWETIVKEGWNKNKTNKQTGEVIESKWNSMRELMFHYRAGMFFARVNCPEALLGLRTTEELLDYIDLERANNGTYGVKEKTEERIEKLKNELGVKPEGKGDRDPDDDLIASFKDLKTIGFRNWEKMHRDKLAQMSKKVQNAFVEKWLKLIGKPYPEGTANDAASTTERSEKTDSEELSFEECPDRPEVRMTKEYCDNECAENREECPAWDKKGNN